MRHCLVAMLIASLLAGCSTAPDADDARAAATAYYDAIRDGDGAAACELLSDALVQQVESQEQKTRAKAATSLDYEGGVIVDVHVFITNAKVDLSTGESVFLTREPGGWKVSALACQVEDGKPRDRPLDCEAEA